MFTALRAESLHQYHHYILAVSEGFEPSELLHSTVFKTAAFVHSANLLLWQWVRDSNPRGFYTLRFSKPLQSTTLSTHYIGGACRIWTYGAFTPACFLGKCNKPDSANAPNVRFCYHARAGFEPIHLETWTPLHLTGYCHFTLGWEVGIEPTSQGPQPCALPLNYSHILYLTQ